MSALDPIVFVLVLLCTLAVTLLASYLPARKASKIDFLGRTAGELRAGSRAAAS